VLGERVHAFISLRDSVTPEELTGFCATRLSREKVPETFTLSTTPLPRNANGKLMKREMREALLRSLAT
jgi:acyl-CoA synthetase (AMP-forming)/AMP-acid ligase II